MQAEVSLRLPLRLLLGLDASHRLLQLLVLLVDLQLCLLQLRLVLVCSLSLKLAESRQRCLLVVFLAWVPDALCSLRPTALAEEGHGCRLDVVAADHDVCLALFAQWFYSMALISGLLLGNDVVLRCGLLDGLQGLLLPTILAPLDI